MLAFSLRALLRLLLGSYRLPARRLRLCSFLGLGERRGYLVLGNGGDPTHERLELIGHDRLCLGRLFHAGIVAQGPTGRLAALA